MKTKINKLLTKGKAIFLAYDQGIEHGPTDFNDRNVDPSYIIDIAQKGKFNAVVFQKGLAEKYKSEIKKSKVPLIIKLNGKTNLYDGEPISKQNCSVKYAKELGAIGVGYTIYIGSKYGNDMLAEFGKIVEEAHRTGLVVVAWVYPRGKAVEKRKKEELMAYAARVGLEEGADIIKIQYHGTKKDLAWAIKSAGKSKVIISGGSKKDEKIFLKEVKDIMSAGAIGLAIGRNVWQHEKPLEISKKIRGIIWK